jgi:hypothetical protein
MAKANESLQRTAVSRRRLQPAAPVAVIAELGPLNDFCA